MNEQAGSSNFPQCKIAQSIIASNRICGNYIGQIQSHHVPSFNQPLRPLTTQRLSQTTYAALLLALAYVCMVAVAGADLDARVRGLRYWSLLAMAVFAIAAPHVLLPDRDLRLMQRLNRSPAGLLKHQLHQWRPVVGLLVLPVVLLAFWDPGHLTQSLGAKTLNAASIVLLLLGTALYSFLRYVRIGPLSQAWQEGTKGDWYRTMKENSPGGFAVPEGMVPAMMATQRVFGVGLLTLVTSAYMGQSVALPLGLVPGAILLVWSATQLRGGLPRHDRSYYATNAFYREVFRGSGGLRVSARETIPYASVYWAPARYKPHLWATLTQLDRKLPLGRVMVMAHALLWTMFYVDALPQTIAAYLLLIIAAKNAAGHLLTQTEFAPLPFQLGRQSARGWIITRFLANLRWTLPLLMSLLIITLFDDSLSFGHALGWTALDIAASLIAALLSTYRTEYRYRRRLA